MSSAEESAALGLHIESCADCRSVFAQLAKSSRIGGEVDSSLAETTPSHVPSTGGRGLPIAPGDVLLEKYEIVDVLGSGGMGVVVRARHLQLNGFVALKFIRPDLAHDADVVSRFSREARAASRLKSPHANRVLDLGALADGTHFMVMELLEGETLEARLGRLGKQPVESVINWALQALDGLGEAHALGIVHRDLKPANLFLQRREGAPEILTILDFGVAKSVNPDIEAGLQQTTTRGLVGSPAYMSPEQLTAGGVVDGRADFWALGCTMYRLLTNESPFRGTDLVDLAWNVRNAEPKDLPDERLRAVIMKALEKSPANRFQDAKQMQAALIAGQTPPLALSPSSGLHHLRRWMVPAAAILIITAALIALKQPTGEAPPIHPAPALAAPPPPEIAEPAPTPTPVPVANEVTRPKPAKPLPAIRAKPASPDAGSAPAIDDVFGERL